jgi:uncharacterized protein
VIIDINNYIGHWPFRQVKNSTAEGLIAKMDKAEIDMAAVSSINAIFYKDTQQGNLELIEDIQPYKDRFLPFAIINPVYTGWEKDFLQCIDDLGMRGLELYPYYHQYKLTDEPAVKLLNMAADKGIPVHLPCAVENIRQKHWMDTMDNLSIDEVEKVIVLAPKTDFIITNGPTHAYSKRLKQGGSVREGRLYYDFARVEVFEGYLDTLIEAAGADSVVFGSQAPFQYIDTQLVKVHYSGLCENDKNKILYGNLKNLFSIE